MLLLFWAGVARGQTTPSYCELSGAAFVEESPVYAQYKVYLETSEAFANLLVFKAQNNLFADRPGLWYLTPTKAQAKFTVAFVKDKSAADFSIFFISQESFAGCR